MDERLRRFLEENGLAADADEAAAWRHYGMLRARGVVLAGYEDVPVPGQEGRSASAPETADGGNGDQDTAGSGGQDTASGASGRQPGGPEVDMAAEVRQAIAAERERVEEIRGICLRAGLPEAEMDRLVREGASLDQARQTVMDHLLRQSFPIGAGAHAGPAVFVGSESRDKLRSAILDGLCLRAGIPVEQPAEGSREFRSRSLHEIARECLEAAGESCRGLSRMQVVGRALASTTSSDFPLLLSQVADKRLAAAYQEWPQTWRPFCAVTDAPDFKDLHSLRLSGSPDLQELTEAGEYRTASFSESGETYRVVTKGLRVPLTRQMIINDDLRAFTRIPAMFGAAARRMEADAVYDLITSNPLMSDGAALFSSAHRNLGSGAALDSASLAAARAMMRRQKGRAGESLDVTPAFLLVPVEMETDSEILLRSMALPEDGKSAGVYNPWAGRLTPIADPHLEGSPWYLLASPAQYPVIEVAYLQGEQQPYVDEQVDFDSDALVIKVRHDFGAGLTDYVGAYKNPGA